MLRVLMLVFSAFSVMSLSAKSLTLGPVEAFEAGAYEKAKTLLQNHANPVEKNFYLGRIALEEGQLDDAEDLLEAAVKANPGDADYQYWFGNLNLRQAAKASIFSAAGYASDAKAHLQKALDINPDHQKALKDLALFYANAPGIAGGSKEKALAMAERLIKLNSIDGYTIKINIFREQEAKAEELEVAGQLSQKFSHSASALFYAGYSYQFHQQYDKAFGLFEKASQLKNEPGDTSPKMALYQLGKTSVVSGQKVEQGIVALEQYLTLELEKGLPGKNWARYRLAALYRQKGELEKARTLAQLATQDEDKSLRKNAKKLLHSLK